MVFQSYVVFTKLFSPSVSSNDPPSLREVCLGGLGAGALQSLLMSPVELVKIRLQLQKNKTGQSKQGPVSVAKNIWKKEGPTWHLQGTRHHCAKGFPCTCLVLLHVRVHEGETSPRVQRE